MRYFLYIGILIVLIVLLIPIVSNIYLQESVTPSQLDIDCVVKVYDCQLGKSYEMELGEYLIHVLAAEMPASFELEALKAQAVAARTYVYKRIKRFGGSGCKSHSDADICTDYRCCQAYSSTEQLKQLWQDEYDYYMEKIARAISDTAGQIITYDGKPIDPLYHSTCGGRTENAEDVWGSQVPYLKSVSCGYCTEAPRYEEKKVFSIQTFAESLAQQDGRVPALAMEAAVPNMYLYQRTGGGSVDSVKIGNVIYQGTQVRAALGLNSTNFSWSIEGDKIVVTTQGYGHGVGLCQYGANGMAKEGYTYDQIINHYYQNIKIERIK